MTLSQLALTLAALSSGRSDLQPAVDKLRKDADAALTNKPYSVMHKSRVPPSGDRHDYLSFGPYWWPDPAKPDGLPFIRRDGEIFPDSRNDASDSVRLHAMSADAGTLALAWPLTRNTDYAAHAALLLKTWFLDPATRMNPHLAYGQAIPGRCNGRAIGIIDTACLIGALEAEALLAGSAAWTDTDHEALKAWAAAYLRWLLTSRHGLEEAIQRNNHGTWYDAQVVSLALFTGDRATAGKTLREVRAKRIATQIREDGSQPHELGRTKSFSYSVMNLRGFFKLAELGDAAGVALWSDPALKKALDFLVPYTDPAKPWPHPEIGPMHRTNLLPLLLHGSRVYKDPAYETAVHQLPADEVRVNRAWLAL